MREDAGVNYLGMRESEVSALRLEVIRLRAEVQRLELLVEEQEERKRRSLRRAS